MSVLIVYQTGKGWVGECVDRLSAGIKGEVRAVDLSKTRGNESDPSAFDTVVLAGAVRISRFPGALRRYCRKHERTLKKKKLAIMFSCLEENEENHEKYLASAFPEALLQKAFGKIWAGGRIRLSDYGSFKRKMLASLIKDGDEIVKDRKENIDRLAEMINGGTL